MEVYEGLYAQIAIDCGLIWQCELNRKKKSIQTQAKIKCEFSEFEWKQNRIELN